MPITHKEVKSKINKLSFEFKKIEEKRKFNHKISRMEEISEQNSMKQKAEKEQRKSMKLKVSFWKD